MAQLNDLLVLGKTTIQGPIKAKNDHDFLYHGNEFTFVPPGYSGDVYFNYRTASGANDGAIANYRFCNGAGGTLANVYGATFYGALSGNATSANYLRDKGNGSATYVHYSSEGMASANWYGAWDGYTLRAIAPDKLATHLATTTLDGRYINATGDTMTGALNFANGTWNLLGDDVWFGDNNTAGSFAIKGNNGATNLKMVTQGADTYGTLTWSGSQFIFSHTINGNITGNAGSANKLMRYGSDTITSTANDLSSNWGQYGLSYHFNTKTGQLIDQPSQWGYVLTLGTGSEVHQMYFTQPSGGVYHRGGNGDGWKNSWIKFWCQGDAVTGAVWNDYAEYRESDCEDFGYVLCEKGDDTLTKTTERLSHFAGVSSDTWGFSQGKTEQATTPIAVAGRVLVYPYQNKMNYKPGDCVCAAPGGTVDIMTREEVIQYPDRIVGTVSCVPDYEEWGGGEGADRDPVKVNGRIWIKVK